MDNDFEKLPAERGEVSAADQERADKWTGAMSEGVPEFGGAQPDNQPETQEDGNEAIAEASVIINYGLNEATKRLGIEAVVQIIKTFDAEGSIDPIGDLYRTLGMTVESRTESEPLEYDIKDDESEEYAERLQENTTKRDSKMNEGARIAVANMKALVSEVETTNPRFNELRMRARALGKGYFETAVNDYEVRGFAELFEALKNQKESDEGEAETGEELLAENDPNADPNVNPDANPNELQTESRDQIDMQQ